MEELRQYTLQYVKDFTPWKNKCKKCCFECDEFDTCGSQCVYAYTTCNQCSYKNFTLKKGEKF